MVVEEDVDVAHPSGLHARPAAGFVTTARTFRSRVWVENLGSGRPAADAKSIVGVLACGIGHGNRIRIGADGDDAALAVASLVSLVTATDDVGTI